MKEKRDRIRFVFLKAAFVDGYRVVKEIVADFNRGTIFRFRLQMQYNRIID